MRARGSISYQIQYTKAAEIFFQTHEDVREEFKKAVRELMVGEHPETVDVKRIRGRKNDYYRIRLGEWRVIYAVIRGKLVVIQALLAGARGDVYKKMGGLT